MVYSAWDVPVMAWTFAAKSLTVKPLGAGASARAARSASRDAGFVEVDTADPAGAQPDAGGQLVEDAVTEEAMPRTPDPKILCSTAR